MAKAQSKKLYKYELPLDGKLITWDDPAKVGPNFQQLTNLRYTKTHPKGVGGMTKITSSQINSTYYKVRSGIHYTKDQPSESHVLVEAFNSVESVSHILQNTTAIPGTGNFSSTALYTPSGLNGRWSFAPDGDVVFCDSEESLIWGGDERELAGFVNYDPGGSFSYDYTEQVRNTLTDAENKAVLNSTSGGIDSNVMLLLHLDNNDTDSSPTTPHTVTDTNVTYSATGKVFGTHWAVFTTNAALTIPDDADFDFSGGTFTIDWHGELDDLSVVYSLYYQNTVNDDDSFNVTIDTNGAVVVCIKAGGAKQFAAATDFSTANGVISAGTTYHIEIVESGDNWYIFVDGILKAYTSDAARAANYTGTVQIGHDTVTYLEGKIDEYRVSNSARHTSDFGIPTEAYSTSTTAVYMYIGSLRPLDGLKLYVGTANISTSSMTLFYWNGSAWTAVSSLSDGTSSGGKSLAQTGSVTFTSTASNAKIKYIDGVMVYWYKIVVDAVSANTSIYYATVSAPFQEIKDIWDGVPNQVGYFQIYDNSSYADATLNVRENLYDSGDGATYVELDGLASSGTDYFVCGFSERAMGVIINFVSGKGNATAGTILTVKYWNGTAWTSVGNLVDGTLENNISLGKTGAVTWGVIGSENEFVKNINNDVQLYYYKFEFSKTLSADVQVYYVTGIPAQKDLKPYKFPLLANDRLFLCNNVKGKKNSVICSTAETSSVFNGDDSVEYSFGDESELTGAAWIYSQFGSSLYNVTLFFKKNETWALVGSGPEDWVKYKVSGVVGCVAPHTIRIIDIGPEIAKTLNRNLVVWQGADGVYISDGRTPILISEDIKDKFDKRLSTSIYTSEVGSSRAFWDYDNKCYHWKWASGTSSTLNEEWVFDFTKGGWFEIDRTSGKLLQAGIEVKDTNGNFYNYGFIDTGYMERLEYGNDFDGEDIAHTLHTGDLVLADGSIIVETTAEYSCLIATAKSNTSADIIITHYGDGQSIGTAWTENPQKSGFRLIFPVEHQSLGAHLFHSFKITISTNDEAIGFEPLYFYVMYDAARDHTRDWRS